jgi:putative flippase GtrA
MLNSLSMFFPFYNDEGTVEKQIRDAYTYGNQVTNDLEVIALIGGKSRDNTTNKILEVKKQFPNLVVVDKTDNWEGYAVIKYGFKAATKDWVFYTDGDAQYHVNELVSLAKTQNETNADVVNGYKCTRKDNSARVILGNLYAKFSSFVFELPIRDTDCDYRLINRHYLSKIDLLSSDASILAELVKKLQLVGATFTEIPVNHYSREYGKSNYTAFSLFKEKLIGDLFLYLKLRKMRGKYRNMRVIRYSMVGLSSVVLQIIAFNILLALTKLNPGIITIIADQAAIVTSFYLNNGFTYKEKKHDLFKNRIKAFIKYYCIIMLSTLMQAGIVFIGTYIFGQSFFSSNIFLGIGLFVSFVWNYLMNKYLVWR